VQFSGLLANFAKSIPGKSVLGERLNQLLENADKDRHRGLGREQRNLQHQEQAMSLYGKRLQFRVAGLECARSQSAKILHRQLQSAMPENPPDYSGVISTAGSEEFPGDKKWRGLKLHLGQLQVPIDKVTQLTAVVGRELKGGRDLGQTFVVRAYRHRRLFRKCRFQFPLGAGSAATLN